MRQLMASSQAALGSKRMNATQPEAWGEVHVADPPEGTIVSELSAAIMNFNGDDIETQFCTIAAIRFAKRNRHVSTVAIDD